MKAMELTTPAVPAEAPPAQRSGLGALIDFRQLIALLVVRELKVRYKRSVFGLIWTMLNPLLLMVVYTIVFTTIMPVAQRNFSIFLLSALLPWIFFNTAVLQGLNSILGNQDLIRKVRVPQAVFPLSVVGSNLVNFTLSMVPLFLLMFALQQRFSAALLFLPVAVLLLTVFTSMVGHSNRMLYGEVPDGVPVGEGRTWSVAALAVSVGVLVVLGVILPRPISTLIHQSVSSLIP